MNKIFKATEYLELGGFSNLFFDFAIALVFILSCIMACICSAAQLPGSPAPGKEAKGRVEGV
jgi:hypothetical protein